MANKSNWKYREAQVAGFFKTKRNPLSGILGGHGTRSDSLHENLFIEQKQRQSHSVRTLHDSTAILAKREDKIPVVTLTDKGKRGFMICVHCDNLDEFIEIYLNQSDDRNCNWGSD